MAFYLTYKNKLLCYFNSCLIKLTLVSFDYTDTTNNNFSETSHNTWIHVKKQSVARPGKLPPPICKLILPSHRISHFQNHFPRGRLFVRPGRSREGAATPSEQSGSSGGSTHRSHLYSRGKAGGGQSPPPKQNQLNYSGIIVCTTRRSSPGPDFQAGLASSSRKEWMWGRMGNGAMNADVRGAARVHWKCVRVIECR